jgi:hypothetical protein
MQGVRCPPDDCDAGRNAGIRRAHSGGATRYRQGLCVLFARVCTLARPGARRRLAHKPARTTPRWLTESKAASMQVIARMPP